MLEGPKGRLRPLLLLLFLCLVTLALGRRVWADEVMTLEKALALAEAHNGQIVAAREQVRQAEAASRSAASQMGPRLDASVAVVRYNEEPRKAVVGGGGGYVPDAFKETWKAALTLTQILYSGGTLQANLQASRLEAEGFRSQELRTVQSVRNAVCSAYFGFQQARAALVVAEEAIALAAEHKKDAESLFNNGLVAKNELLRAQVALSDAELDRIRAANAVDTALKALERTVGVAFQASTVFPEPLVDLPDFALPELVEAETRALASRPELKALEASRGAAEFLARAAAGQARPQIALEAEANDVGDSFYPDVQDQWKVTLAAQWRLFDSGEVRANVDKARSAAAEVLARMDDLRRQISLEVSTARLDLDSALQRLRVATDQVALAEEDHRMALKRYKAQVGTNLDVLDAQVALTNSRTQLVLAVYDAFQADADLTYAIGDEALAPMEGDAPVE